VPDNLESFNTGLELALDMGLLSFVDLLLHFTANTKLRTLVFGSTFTQRCRIVPRRI